MAKGPDAFRTISEAADEVGVPQHVLRFWETKFSFIRPMKRAGGRRFYRPADIAVLKGVRALLHDKGYTIKGAQKFYREEGSSRLADLANGEGERAAPAESRTSGAPSGGAAAPSAAMAASPQTLREVLAELESAKQALDAALAAR